MNNNYSLFNPQLLSALFYGLSSILVIFANKSLLTQFGFPYFNFVATAQFVLTSIFLFILSLFRIFEIPTISLAICLEILPLSLMFLGNVVTGLGSTKSLNLPMFTALRRFSILMTMCGEWIILENKPNNKIIVSILCMVLGSFIAAMYDLTFDPTGYILIFANNLFTAINGVWMKKTSLSGKCSKMGIMFYNSLFSAIIMMIYLSVEHQYYNHNVQGIIKHRILNNHIYMPTNNISTLYHIQAFDDHYPFLLHINTYQLNGNHSDYSMLYDRRYLLDSNIHDTITNTNTDLKNTNIRGSLSKSSSSSSTTTISSSVIDKEDMMKANEILLHKHQEFDRIQQEIKENLSKMKDKSTITHVFEYSNWTDITFLIMFFTTCIMGSILNFAIFICTTINSALTTAVIGALKNIATTYVAMLVFSDYKFTWINFMGINISTCGSFYYTYITLFKRNSDSHTVSKI